ncbi:MAG: hypothetical protein WA063_03695 [Minisyncoccia bacterium]
MDIINIEKEEELGTIILKIERSGDKEVALSIPENALILQSVINLKILKKRAEELGKVVSIARVKEDKGPIIAAGSGLSGVGRPEQPDTRDKKIIRTDTAEKKQEKRDPDPSSGDPKGSDDRKIKISNSAGKIKMFDIGKKVENTGSVNTVVSIEDRAARDEVVREDRVALEKKNIINYSRAEKVQVGNSKRTKKIVLLPSIISKFFIAFVAVVIITVLVSVAMTLPKVNIGIKLKAEAKDYTLDLKVDETMDKIDADKNKIPAKKIDIKNEISETYPATGKKHIVSKASGKITIYNEFSSNDQKIVATTRFLSKDGHIFKVDENVTISGFSRVEGKDVPGEIVVTVYADKAGEEYNIGPESFTLPGFQGTGKYSAIYARSSAAMTGGADREALYFSESDYITAKGKLTKMVKDKNDQDFLNKAVENTALLNGTRKEDETKISTDVIVGNVADNFKMTVSTGESALFINNNDIDEIVNWKINSETDGSMEILDSGKKPEILETKKAEDGSFILPVKASRNVVLKVDVDKIKSDLYGKNEEEVRAYFQNIEKFDSVDVTFSCTKKVPSSNDKIDIKIEK